MNILKPIIGFVTHKKGISAVIGVALIGTASAAGVLANTNLISNDGSSSSASSQVSETSSSEISVVSQTPSSSEISATSSVASSTPSSNPSSSVSSTPSSSPSSTASIPSASSSAPSSSTVDNTAARNSALAAENTRHTNALTAISNQYDPQISALQTEIASFQTEGAKDETSNVTMLQKQADDAWTSFNHISSEYGFSSDEGQIAFAHYNECETVLKKYQALNTDYQKMVQDQSSLDSFQMQKQTAINSENVLHQANITAVQIQYP